MAAEQVGLYKYIDENGVVHLLYPVTRTDAIDAVSDLPMGGFKVTGLGTPTESGDAVPLGYANKNFAPTGWGLGNTSPKTINGVDAMDAATANGFYYVTGLGGVSFGGVPVVQGLLLAIGKDSYHTDHYFYPAGVDAILWREMEAGVWDEWCCENPPMYLGVEYRTIERWNGELVYTKLIDCGALVDGKTITLNIIGAKLIRGVAHLAGRGSLPFDFGSDHTYNCRASFDNGIYLNSNGGYDGCTIHAQIWYTKE